MNTAKSFADPISPCSRGSRKPFTAPLVRRTWAPRGHTPVLMQRGRSRRKVSVIGALVISPRRRRVRAYFGLLPDANFDGESILAFVVQLCRALRVPIALIWDRLGAHIG